MFNFKKVLIIFTCFIVIFLNGCGSEKRVDLNEENTTFRTIYNLAVENDAITSSYDDWLKSIIGEEELRSTEVVFQISNGFIEWKYVDDTTWNNIIKLSNLVGVKGEDGEIGKDGKEVVFQVSNNFIQWKYDEDTTWTNLISLSTLTGKKGLKGESGSDAREILFQVSKGYIQWRYDEDSTWTNLVSLSTLTGIKGEQGEPGKSAYEIYLENNPEYEETEEEWINSFIDSSNEQGLDFYLLGEGNGYAVSAGNARYLNSIDIPSTYKDKPVTTILPSAFMNCNTIKSITIPESITSIGEDAFQGCTSLTIYAKAESKPAAWDDAWNSSSRPVVFGYVSNDVTASGIEYGVSLINSKYNVIVTGYQGSSNAVVIPGAIESYPTTIVASSTFYNCSNLTSIIIPTSITSIGGYAFEGCSSLTNIVIPISVTNIGEQAFLGCTSLTSITIPDSVASIGEAVFSGCSSLETLVLPFVGASRSSTGINGIFGYTFGSSSYTGGTATEQYYGGGRSITHYIPTSLRTVTITSTTVIGIGAFYNCSNLTSITLPTSIININIHAFNGCTGLTSITIPTSVTTMGGNVFYNCSNLTIYARASSKPIGWHDSWNVSSRPVVWGYTG